MVLPIETVHFMIFGLGFNELLIILLIFLVLFGASKIPQLARGLGKGITEFKKGLKDVENNDDAMKELEEDTKKNGE
jgi:sec-independent protein translocase protein TatA